LFGQGRGTARAEDERRVRVRYPCSLPTTLSEAHSSDAESITGRVQNVSRSGIRLLVARRYVPGELVSVELPAGQTGESTAVLACVIHCQPQPEGLSSLGCSFLSELSDDDLLVLGARRIRPTPPDQRAWRRFPCRPEARYHPVRTPAVPDRPIEVVDLSSGGVALRTTDPIHLGDVLELAFQYGDKPAITTLASVVRITRDRPDGFHLLGCAFIGELNDREIELLI
jgi:hypothetical protein